MWVQLTLLNDQPILMDSDKVLTITSHPKGAHLTFTTPAPDKEGKMAPKSMIVREDISLISKLLRPRFSGFLP